MSEISSHNCSLAVALVQSTYESLEELKRKNPDQTLLSMWLRCAAGG
jgi:hypothetical protein